MFLLFALLFSSLSCAKLPKAVRPKEITGAEWLQISKEDRQKYLLASMNILELRGINPKKSANDYYHGVETRLEQRPDLNTKDVTSILTTLIYEGEPENREALDKLGGKREMNE